MSNPSDFVIENGVLKKYLGPGGDVVVPNGVTSIGDSVFSRCFSLTSVALPEGLTSIGNYAFSGCSSLNGIALPEGVTSIGGSAFFGCSSLSNITLPKSLIGIGGEAFRGCDKLSDSKGFVIVNDVIYDYYGPGGNVTVPESVTSISNWAFFSCKSLISLVLPDSITSIGSQAFASCDSLIDATLPANLTSIDDFAFSGCCSLKSIVLPETIKKIGACAFRDCCNLESIHMPENLKEIGIRAFADCSSLTSINLPENVQIIGNAAFEGCKGLADDQGFVIIKGILFDYLGSGRNAIVPDSVSVIGSDAFREHSNVISITLPKTLLGVGDAMFYGCKKLKDISLPNSVVSIGRDAFRECKSLSSISLPENLSTIGENAFKGCKKLSSVVLPEGRDIAWIVDLDSKGQLCEQFSSSLEELCCLSDEASMTALITKANKWPSKWKKLFFASYLHSDTRAAMLLADKRGEFAQYAAMRGADEDELRDRMLSDLGLDENRCKAYNLGNQTVTVRLMPDLTFALELPDGTPLKALPKKGTDPGLFKQAKDDLAQMNKDVGKIWKNRADVLLGDFLSGKERSAEYWKTIYSGNPILHAVACLLVWEQGGMSFTRTDAGTIRADGAPYTLTDESIRLAHPMEMNPDEVTAWQHYFTSHGLKQPFEQIWEPVEDASQVAPGRYDGCTIPLYYLMNKEKHGIIMEGQKKLTLRDCSADLEFIQGHHDWINNEFEIKNFRFEKYTRQVNHIVVHFDKGTVAGRVKKDDVTVTRWFDRFTLAQITEFIAAAQEANAVNVLAALLEYKNTHFADFDPMDEFTLEW